MSEAARKLVWTPHPVIPLPTRPQLQALVAKLGEEAAGREIAKLHEQREEAIRLEREDPLRHGFEPETFTKARELLAAFNEVYLLGGNREGKTWFAIKYAIEDMVKNPGKVWAFLHMTETSSIRQQQAKVYAMLPPEWRDLGKVGESIYVKYTKQNGFSGGQFILPNGSTGMFFNYKQDADVLQGYELDGALPDELCPLEFIENLAFRVGKGRTLKILVNFTPVNGYTPTVARAIVKARVVEHRRASLLPENMHLARDCPPGCLPYVMKSQTSAVLFFHNGMNPYGASAEIARELRDKPIKMIKERAYGWADKLITSALPKYGAVHRITRERFNEIERSKRGGTRYCVADPGGTKNWFIKWYFCTPNGWTIVYREWPDFAQHGDWALHPDKADKVDWRPGEAQRMNAGRGMADYRRLILELEGNYWDGEKWNDTKAEKIAARLIDPRFGGMAVPSQDEGTSIMELMDTPVRDHTGREVVPPMTWEEAPNTGVTESIQLISDAMDYDTERPVDATNCPKWYVVDDLPHSDLAYREFTELGGQKNALKDIIDPDRYFIKAGYGHLDAALMKPRGMCYY